MNRSINQIPEADRPREKLLRKGARALSDQELLAVLLGKGTPGMDVMTLAGKLARFIDEKGLEVQADDLIQFEGVGDAKATLILAGIEFARRRRETVFLDNFDKRQHGRDAIHGTSSTCEGVSACNHARSSLSNNHARTLCSAG